MKVFVFVVSIPILVFDSMSGNSCVESQDKFNAVPSGRISVYSPPYRGLFWARVSGTAR